jgi:hypothetical protein
MDVKIQSNLLTDITLHNSAVKSGSLLGGSNDNRYGTERQVQDTVV